MTRQDKSPLDRLRQQHFEALFAAHTGDPIDRARVRPVTWKYLKDNGYIRADGLRYVPTGEGIRALNVRKPAWMVGEWATP